MVLLTAQPLRAQSASETARIEKLEQRGGNTAKTKRTIESRSQQLEKAPCALAAVLAKGKQKRKSFMTERIMSKKWSPWRSRAADKWKLSTSITEMELYGDIRLRYQYNGGETESTGRWQPPARASQGHTIGRSASASVIVFAWAFVERLWMIGSSVFGWRRATMPAQQM